jgi:serine protease AprX
MTKRFKIRFPSHEAMNAAQAIETPNSQIVLRNERRSYIAVEVPDVPEEQSGLYAIRSAVETAPEISQLLESYNAEVVEDYQYDLEDTDTGFDFEETQDPPSASLAEVTEMINAPGAWVHSTGREVNIAIVDTGIDGSHPEFPSSKRVGHWEPPGDVAWTDWQGHGTMCAAISAASDKPAGSRYRGVAPDANLIACKTHFYDSELGSIYDYLTDLAGELDAPLVASNSFGRRTGTPPPDPGQSDFIDALGDAIAAGVFVFFSAGNNHQNAGGAPNTCDPNSIWLHKSRADVFPVATCDLDRAMWYYSSRGPGQHFGQPNTSRKPDATAPTPRNGKILYGGGERVLPNGWGTSGACPQAAGLAALLLSLDNSLTRKELFDGIRDHSTNIGYSHTCQGHGMIDCSASVNHVLARPAS